MWITFIERIEVRVDDDDDDSIEEIINASGLTLFFADVGVDPEDVSLLVFSYHLQAKEMGIFTKDEFIKGMTKLQYVRRYKK